MKILFIYPTATYKSYHYGIAILSAVLKRAGHTTEMEFVHAKNRFLVKAYLFLRRKIRELLSFLQIVKFIRLRIAC